MSKKHPKVVVASFCWSRGKEGWLLSKLHLPQLPSHVVLTPLQIMQWDLGHLLTCDLFFLDETACQNQKRRELWSHFEEWLQAKFPTRNWLVVVDPDDHHLDLTCNSKSHGAVCHQRRLPPQEHELRFDQLAAHALPKTQKSEVKKAATFNFGRLMSCA